MTRVKCLLVDDLDDNLLVLEALLRRDDVELLMARSGVEALDLLLSHDVALALVDVQMPEMDGFELAELMRGSERTRHVPIIFVTAGTRDQNRLFKGYDSGAVDFLFKPIEPAILKNKAEVFFQLHRQKLQIEDELRQRTEMLRLQEMFAGVLGHDLRTPLGAIISSAQLLPRISSDPQVQEIAARVLASGRRMGRMVEDLLDLTRARLGSGIPAERHPIDLADVASRVVQEHRVSAPSRTINLHVDGNTAGEWDGGRVAQMLSNLVGNALQHGAAGSPVDVTVDGRRPDLVTISVANAGTIDPALSHLLFDPFQRGRAGRAAGDGRGLGLFITRQIAHAHQGQVEVAEEPPGQVVFRVTLPRATTAAA
jgi:signal transduction histidine kinase